MIPRLKDLPEGFIEDFTRKIVEGYYNSGQLTCMTPDDITPEDIRIVTEVWNSFAPKEYDSNFGDKRLCECGHPYYRHFDSYEEMRPAACKYCGCFEFKERNELPLPQASDGRS